ncbi:MAG TPA: hypothetical protein VF407_18725 [Polyangiaceae bacterium]
MKRALAFTVAFSLGSLAVVACGGVDQPDLFGPSSSSGTDAGKDSGAVKDGGGGGGSDASLGTDAGGSGEDASVVLPDSGSPPVSTTGIYCGGTGASALYCTGGDICCVRNNQGGTSLLSYECTNEGACDDDSFGDLVVPCARKIDCKGKQVCCGTFVSGSPAYYDEVTCDTDCTDSDNRVFCDPANGNADCPSPQTCQTSGAMPGFHVCGS